MRHPLRSRCSWPARLLVCLALAYVAIAARAQTATVPLLWKATSATNVVFLYGTLHVGMPDFYPLPEPVESAFAGARVIALEADPTNQTNMSSALARAGYKVGESIDQFIAPDLVVELKGAVPTLGLPYDAARRMKPYLLSMALTMIELGRMGYDAQLGLDIHFAHRAKRDSKKLIELESISGQLALFEALSPNNQEHMLRATLHAIRAGELQRDLTELISAWRAGDETLLLQLVERDTREFPPALREEFKRLFYDARNQAMAEQVASFLERGAGPHFVAVGAGHLPGETGIIELLRNKGFAVTRVR